MWIAMGMFGMCHPMTRRYALIKRTLRDPILCGLFILIKSLFCMFVKIGEAITILYYPLAHPYNSTYYVYTRLFTFAYRSLFSHRPGHS